MNLGDDHLSEELRRQLRAAPRGWFTPSIQSAIKLCGLILLCSFILLAGSGMAAPGPGGGSLQDWLANLTDSDFDPQKYMSRLAKVPLSAEQRQNLDELKDDMGLDFDTSKLTAKDVIKAPGKLLDELDSDLQFKVLCRLVLDQMAVGDFGPGSDEQVLILRPYGKTQLYRADGSSTELRWSRSHYLAGPVAWDYDRDGIDELVPRRLLALPRLPELRPEDPPKLEIEDRTPEGRTPVYDLTGKEIARLKGVPPLGQKAVTIDLDGDGWDELLLADCCYASQPSSLNFRVYGARGELVWRFSTGGSQSLSRGRFGHPAQDCIYSYENGEVLAYCPQQEAALLEDWPPGAVPAVALGARNESWPVLASDDGFLYDTWTSHSCELSLAEPCGAYQLFGEPRQRLAAGQFESRRSELAYCPYYNNAAGTLFFYDEYGKLARELSLGEDVVRIATLHQSSGDLLAVQTLSGVRFVSGQNLLAASF